MLKIYGQGGYEKTYLSNKKFLKLSSTLILFCFKVLRWITRGFIYETMCTLYLTLFTFENDVELVDLAELLQQQYF